jgi:hypothetical protein
MTGKEEENGEGVGLVEAGGGGGGWGGWAELVVVPLSHGFQDGREVFLIFVGWGWGRGWN